MKRPLFDIITTAHTGHDGLGAFDVRIVGRYGSLDGLEIGHTENVTITEAMEFATATVDELWSEILQERSN